MKSKLASVILLISFALLTEGSFAGSATWNLNPTSGDWNTAANWTPNTVPNDPNDIATFGASNVTNVFVSASTEVNSIVFSPGASAFTITANPTSTLTLSGTGVANNSAIEQDFVAAADQTGSLEALSFLNSATAGSQTVFTVNGSIVSKGVAGIVRF